METLPLLLALCDGNTQVTKTNNGKQRVGSNGVSFIVSLNKLWSADMRRHEAHVASL